MIVSRMVYSINGGGLCHTPCNQFNTYRVAATTTELAYLQPINKRDPQMFTGKVTPSKWSQVVVVLSLLLLFFTIPHTLEDFATGEPAKAGIPAPVLSLVVSTVFFLQAMGLFWLGRGQRRGLWVHAGIGLFWPIASGFAQLPSILGETAYRSGAISVLYVAGMIAIGALLCFASIRALMSSD
jgi:hypothetical protein